MLLLLLMPIMMNVVSAYSTTQLHSMLAGFNVSNSTIYALSPVMVNYSKGTYLILYKGSSIYMVANVTTVGNYKIVTNSTLIFNIIKPTVLQKTLSNLDLMQLQLQMENYTTGTNSSITQTLQTCLIETGLNTGLTCTVDNNCNSCYELPLCRCTLLGVGCPVGVTPAGGGVTGYFGQGIVNFESQYDSLNTSVNSFNSLITNTNETNFGSARAGLVTDFNNISTITREMPDGALFPTPSNITNDQLGMCAANPAVWYCHQAFYCGYLDYNYTLLNKMQVAINNLSALTVSDAQINNLASQISTFASSLIGPILNKEQTALLDTILNTTLLGYNTTINSSTTLLGHIQNSTLSTDVAVIQSAYQNLTANYLNLNLTQQEGKLSTKFSKLKSDYSSLNNTYNNLLEIQTNTTRTLLKAQLNARTVDSQASSLALESIQIGAQLVGKISNLSQAEAQLSSISKQAKSAYFGSVPILSLTELSRVIGGGFTTLLLPMFNMSYPDSVAAAPLTSVLFALIIGVIIILLIYREYAKMKKNRKIMINRNTQKNWQRLFILLLVLLVIFLILSFIYASGANGFAPYSAFGGAVGSSKYVALIINGTSNQQMSNCISIMSKTLKVEDKLPLLVNFSNDVCKTTNATQSVSACMNSYAKSGIPMVILTSGQGAHLRVYSFYRYLSCRDRQPELHGLVQCRAAFEVS